MCMLSGNSIWTYFVTIWLLLFSFQGNYFMDYLLKSILSTVFGGGEGPGGSLRLRFFKEK